MRVIIAPDSFKGSASAAEVAAAIAEGWSRVRPRDELTLLPMADGGEGTLDAFELAVPGAQRMPVTVTGPGEHRPGIRDIDASWLLLPASDGTPRGTALVELAATSGLTLLDRMLPLEAHTLGFGQAIVDALEHGVSRLLLAVGGSASTDGGSAALAALGARFLDASGQPIALGGGALAQLASVDLSGLRALPPGGALVLGDVTNPLLGPFGAARVFGAQKGADAAQRAALDRGLATLAALLPAEPTAPGAGAAGGTGYGLLAWGARMAPGADAVGDAIGLPEAVAQADVIITGEGRFDAQSAAGKVAGYVARVPRPDGARMLLIAGGIDASVSTDAFTASRALTELAGGLDAALDEPLRWLREAGASLAG
ncbi:glycerate kinase [Homoserinimonas aerilata]|uniref:Glycerate kinase n=1 Tax=Homoserinimonas aerilata TaxID=1162970 RepID=A0A542YL52_9MICO|nr:glycerate kinase [Homoserinimonas aerilata]TQL48803.1 glycerate kinase [Homoserinimonas aerilata]